ncbi:GntR family transcriptional regulator [Variovorax sp. M-6]|uniref:GntR family transcriptional regulator n=1 Tax=Variovorax sp. M-6 TaxID=3233041 RepID=UPI003F969E3C
MNDLTRTQGLQRLIRDAIFRGEFKPDEHLSEYALAERYEASRTPVRNALSGLAAQDLVVYRENRGYVVRNMTRPDVLGRLRVRAAMEGLAARMVAMRPLSDGVRATLRGALLQCQEASSGDALSQQERDHYVAGVHLFNDALRKEAGLTLLNETIERSMYFPFKMPAGVVWVEHEEFVVQNGFSRAVHSGRVDRARIVEAIEEGNGMRAETLTREHMFIVSLGVEMLLEKYGN